MAVSKMKITLKTNSKAETVALGVKIAKYLVPNSVVTLAGDLGAGKTTLVSGIAKGLGIIEQVTSPTFNIMKCYFHKPISLYHIDAYRLDGVNKDIGLEEFIDGDGVCVVEWPNYISEMLPLNALEIVIHNLGDDVRELSFSSTDKRFESLIKSIGGK